ncbi:MAG: hypothetical protein ORN54_11085, partial [Cyclobacteriaceae bacterium]|nr:hypothetical protein [Cyclobacteriaceae bacterium]
SLFISSNLTHFEFTHPIRHRAFKIYCSSKLNSNEKFQFKIGADANLFFRNVRQVYYDRESPDGKWQAYRFSNRKINIEQPSLNAIIVIHWIKDEAYLLIEPNSILAEEDLISVVIKNQSDTIRLKERGRERMLEFGSKIYEAVQAKKDMTIFSKGKYVPLLRDESEREALRITIADYYRLTGIF